MDDFGNALHFTDQWRAFDIGLYGWCDLLCGHIDFNDLYTE